MAWLMDAGSGLPALVVECECSGSRQLGCEGRHSMSAMITDKGLTPDACDCQCRVIPPGESFRAVSASSLRTWAALRLQVKGKHSPIRHHIRLTLRCRVPDGHKPRYLANQGGEEASRQTSRFHTPIGFDEGGVLECVREPSCVLCHPGECLVPYQRQGRVH